MRTWRETVFTARRGRRLPFAPHTAAVRLIKGPYELSTCLNAAKVPCCAPARRTATESWRSFANAPSGSSGSAARSTSIRFFVYRILSVSARLRLRSSFLAVMPCAWRRAFGRAPPLFHGPRAAATTPGRGAECLTEPADNACAMGIVVVPRGERVPLATAHGLGYASWRRGCSARLCEDGGAVKRRARQGAMLEPR